MKNTKMIVFTMKELNIESHTYIVDKSYEICYEDSFDEVYMDLEDKYGDPIIEIEENIYSNIENIEIKEVNDID